MSIAKAEKYEQGKWWVVSMAFPSSVHHCQSLAVAIEIATALNMAWEMGKEAKRQEIAEAYDKFEDLLRPPHSDDDYSHEDFRG